MRALVSTIVSRDPLASEDDVVVKVLALRERAIVPLLGLLGDEKEVADRVRGQLRQLGV